MRLTGSGLSRGMRFVERPPMSPTWAATAIATGLFLIFALDRVTGAAPVQHLYYLPIIVAAVRFGRRGSLAASVLAIVFYHLANPRPLTLFYEESDLLQIAVFVAVGVVSDKLANDARRLHRLAMTDDLTGLHNLRSFEEQLRIMVRAARETKTPLSMLVLDLDRLKSLNDAHGHLAGAEAVRTVGRILAERLPPTSAACRYGGDEFVVALPWCGQSEAIDVADDLRHAVNSVTPVLAGITLPTATLSISVGAACWTLEQNATVGNPPAGDTVGEALFQAADLALYSAKNGGRNRVSVAPK